MTVELIASPLKSKVDEQLDIKIRGLKPAERIELSGEQIDLFGGLWKSETVYIADNKGEVNLSRDTPTTGGYDWVDPMGPILTLKAESEPGRSIGHLLQKTEPFKLKLRVKREDGEVIEQQLHRSWMDAGVRSEEIKVDGLFAKLYRPAGAGPFPTVIILNGSEGGLNENKASLLANHGFAAMALAYSNYESLPKTIVEIPIEYFEKALNFLKSHSDVDNDKLGITGFSYGGMLSLYLSSNYPELKATVAYSPSCYLFGAVGDDYNLPIASFTKKSEPVPFIRYPKNADSYFVESGSLNAIKLRKLFINAVEEAPPDKIEAAAICVESIKGSVLLFSGTDDCMWPSSEFCETAVERMKSRGHVYGCEHVCYSGAGHFINYPYTPLPPEIMIHPTDHKRYAFGGKDRGNAEASKKSWQKELDFLKEVLS